MDTASFNIKQIIANLSKKRPVFHSEADFQHALAWEIQITHPQANIRLEINPYADGIRSYIDILVRYDNITYALELKYKTCKSDIEYNGEAFHLMNHSAQDIGRYDFIKDVVRLERFIGVHPNAKGIAIFLSNDIGYWNNAVNGHTIDSAFRIYENRVIEGTLGWGTQASTGTMKGRENKLNLLKSYSLKWVDYSKLSEDKRKHFRYLLLEI